MKKLPIIGLIVGAVAAAYFAVFRRKKPEPDPYATPNPQDNNPPE